MCAVFFPSGVVDLKSVATISAPLTLTLTLPCRARIGLLADAVRRARRMRPETLASPREGRGAEMGGAQWV